MPVVPRVAGPQVEQQPARPVFQQGGGDLNAFGGSGEGLRSAGAAIERFGSGLADVAAREQAEDNERQAKELGVLFDEKVRMLTYGDGTPENQGFFAAQGQTALDRAYETKKAVTEARRELLKRTSNGRVVEMFGRYADLKMGSAFEGVDRHTTAQRKIANDATSAARIASAVNDAAAAWSDPKVLQRSRMLATTEVVDMAERNGWTPEIAQGELRKVESGILEQVIRSAEAVDPVKAFEIFSTNEDALLPATRTALRNALKDGVLAAKSQEITDGFMAKGAALGWSLNQHLAHARAVLSGKEEDDVVSRLSQRFAERHSAVVQARTAAEASRAAQDRAASSEAPIAAKQYVDAGLNELEALDRAVGEHTGVKLQKVQQEIREYFAAKARVDAATEKGEGIDAIGAAQEYFELNLPETEALARAGRHYKGAAYKAVAAEIGRLYAARDRDGARLRTADRVERVAATARETEDKRAAEANAPSVAFKYQDENLSEPEAIRRATQEHTGPMQKEVIRLIKQNYAVARREATTDRVEGRAAATEEQKAAKRAAAEAAPAIVHVYADGGLSETQALRRAATEHTGLAKDAVDAEIRRQYAAAARERSEARTVASGERASEGAALRAEKRKAEAAAPAAVHEFIDRDLTEAQALAEAAGKYQGAAYEAVAGEINRQYAVLRRERSEARSEAGAARAEANAAGAAERREETAAEKKARREAEAAAPKVVHEFIDGGLSESEALAEAVEKYEGVAYEAMAKEINRQYAVLSREDASERRAGSAEAKRQQEERATQAVGIVRTMVAAGYAEEQALGEAVDVYTGDLLQRVNQEIRKQFAVRRREAEDARKFALSGAWDAISTGASLMDWRKANPADFARLNTTDLDALNRYEIRSAEGRQFATATDFKKFGELRQLPPDQLAEVNITAAKEFLAQSEWKQLVGLVEGAKEKIKANTSKLSEALALGETRIDRLMPRKSNGKPALTPAQLSEVKNQLNAFIYARQNEAKDGAPPSDEEIDRQATLLMLNVEERGAIWGADDGGLAAEVRTRLNEIDPEDRRDLFVPFARIPQPVKDTIEARSAALGFDPKAKGFKSFVEAVAGATAVGAQAEFAVPADTLPPRLRADLESKLRENGKDVTAETLEELAGAVFMQDVKRIRRLLGLGTQ